VKLAAAFLLGALCGHFIRVRVVRQFPEPLIVTKVWGTTDDGSIWTGPIT
jgi:hypothetical protein